MDFYSKAIKEFGQSFGTAIVPTSIGQNYVTVVGPERKKIRKRNSYIVVAQNRDYQTVNPSTTIAAALLNGGQCEFRIESGIADVIDYCMIKLQVSNATGGAVVLAPAQMLINSIQVWAQNGSNLLNTVYGHELYLGNAFLPRNEYENFCDGLGLTTAYASAATSIANGSTATLYIPIFQPFMPSKLHPAGLQGNLLVRVLFNTTALTHVSGSLLDVSNCVLNLRSRDQPNALQSEQENFYTGPIPLSLCFQNIQRQSVVMTLAASSTYSITLSGINGIVSTLFWTIRPAAITASNCITYYAPQDFDIQTSDGSSLIGFTRRTGTEALWDYAECFDNLFRKNVNFNCVPFSNDPVNDYANGSNYGYMPFTSFEKLSFTTASTLVGASYTIDIIAFVHDNINIVNGRAQSMKSQ